MCDRQFNQRRGLILRAAPTTAHCSLQVRRCRQRGRAVKNAERLLGLVERVCAIRRIGRTGGMTLISGQRSDRNVADPFGAHCPVNETDLRSVQ